MLVGRSPDLQHLVEFLIKEYEMQLTICIGTSEVHNIMLFLSCIRVLPMVSKLASKVLRLLGLL
jgi:hypothetical protein